MDSLPVWLIIVLVVAAVGVGLWVGTRAGALAPADKRGEKRTIGARVRDVASASVVSLWKWNRRRKIDKKRDE